MAKCVLHVFFEHEPTVREAAQFSTQGDTQRAVSLLARLQPTYTAYLTDVSLCVLNGFLRLPLTRLQELHASHYSAIRYHCDEQRNVKFKVPLVDTLLLQTHVLLSCGAEFALQYVTDCYLHQPQNDFVRSLYAAVTDRVTMFPEWARLQQQGAPETQHALTVCATALVQCSEAKKIMRSLLQLTSVRCNPLNHHLFMTTWDSVQEALGVEHTVVQPHQFRERPSAHAPKSLRYGDELRLYHPDDIDRILVLTLMHTTWLTGPKSARPSEFAAFWDACGV